MLVLAALWGFAEATLFFIVPDVCLTLIALSDLRLALAASGVAVAAAVLGGGLMHEWGRRHPQNAVEAIDRVPGISPALIARVEHELRTRGWFPMFAGSILAVPYKIYAVKTGVLGWGRAAFLTMSVFARAIRFVALVCLTSWISGAFPVGPILFRQLFVLGVWIVVYVIYFKARRP
jgi:membrane protein YqaA with SNARE-associated domain